METESGAPAGYKIPIIGTSGVNENLYDKDAKDTNNGYISGAGLQTNGETISNAAYEVSEYIEIDPAENYVSMNVLETTRMAVCFYSNTHEYISGHALSPTPLTLSIPQNAKYLRVSVVSSYTESDPLRVTYGTEVVPERYTSNYDLFIGDSKLGEYEYVDFTTQKIYKLQEGVLTPTDPPAPLPSIITYDGENTISSTETLGDVEFTGEWSAIMGSTEDESIDIEFTVDAEEYIAFVAVDDGPSIQVSDTITMPSSADSFTLEVVAWGRERYTDTVYNALS